MKCKYAGDKNDNECVNCDGKTMFVEGKVYACNDVCEGFENGGEEEQPIVAPTVATPIQEQLQEKDNTMKSVPILIGAKSGLTKEINGVWYKFEAWEEREIPVDCKFDVKKEKELLFDKLNNEVDKQCLDVINGQK